MNKYQSTVLCFFLLFAAVFCTAQEIGLHTNKGTPVPIEDRANELKIGLVKLLAGPILDLEYERIANTYTSYGGNIVFNVGENYFEYDFSLSPFYRIYFTERKQYGTKGLFIQGFMGYYTGEDYYYYHNSHLKKYHSFGAGVGLGWKWVNKQGFVLQFLVGGARTIAGGRRAPEGLFQGDLSVGYRF
ncbi:hypothetical protein WIW50_11945 [Flavobacteriaceae bacterium 3-367]|uniref:hypothetical protein n=1 Tax=Eudoraea algarum TaxID=3417568 RepID=UPI0032734E09